ncbi:hypothetical protein EJ02DRAFT_503278 [Clathrospora elynae]|uniref:Uncharacterized protein n=1 Tax=Clathrospora elynae TaxID=706981 RepID=A0A6A5SM80_9PLEO|nr:hypothetical protein EJ02DRAFT_503278 [Clathrospora elynae]
MSQNRTHKPLSITPTPFKSSFLSIPPSPFSPRTPLTPNLSLLPQHAQKQANPSLGPYFAPIVDAPSSPSAWVWTCHQCHRSYHIGVTRRCLEDGHNFCAGTTTIQAWRQPGSGRGVKKHSACASEFDYAGWKAWGRWRRMKDSTPTRASTTKTLFLYTGGVSGKLVPGGGGTKKDCWNTCDYPSECRWGKKFGVHTPVETVFPTLEVNTTQMLTAPAESYAEGILKPENCKALKMDKQGDNATFWGALIASTKRRKGDAGLAGSPLVFVADEADGEEEGEREAETKNGDGDVVMADTPSTSTSTHDFDLPPLRRSESTSAVDLLKFLIRRKKTSRNGRMAHQDRSLAESMLTVLKPVELKNDEHIRLSDPVALLDGLEPLARLKNRDSVYQSEVDCL